MARRAKKPPAGLPPWLATFADMATLLMCFFVLLLAFSEMDVAKYKSVAGSMKKALGVKADSHEVTLPEGKKSDIAEIRGDQIPTDPDAPQGPADAETGQELSPDAALVRRKLRGEIEDKKISVESMPDRVIIRLPEQGLFGSGSATLDPGFVPTLEKIRDVLATTEGSIVVAGHTDDRPIATARFPSNWVLSSARSAAVVHLLVDDARIDPTRLVAQGYADTRPLAPNADNASRARNRRVDIILATRAAPAGKSGARAPEGSEEEKRAGEDGRPSEGAAGDAPKGEGEGGSQETAPDEGE